MEAVLFVDRANESLNIGILIYNSERYRDFPNLQKFSSILSKKFYTIKIDRKPLTLYLHVNFIEELIAVFKLNFSIYKVVKMDEN